MPAIHIEQIGKAFDGRPVLADVNLSVPKGHSTAIVGPSGCGKTTLLRIVAGLDAPDQGRVRFGDALVSGDGMMMAPEDRNLGMVFQDGALWPHLRVATHLDYVLKARLLNRVERRGRVQALLETAQLTDKARAFPGTLSGGEQQRLAILRALACDPSILLLDEPFSNLDRDLRERLAGEIDRRRREEGMTVIVATHDPTDVEVLADDVVELPARRD